jgi:ABC-type dipeptide/oligopeptide/nickel transport system permease subunit
MIDPSVDPVLDDTGLDDDVWSRAPAAVEADALSGKPLSARRRFLKRFLRQRLAVGALIVVVLFALMAIFAPWLTPEDPNKVDLANALQPPFSGNGLGTDHLGRDELSRLIASSRVSMQAAFESVAIGIVLGVPAGLLAGFYGRTVDRVLTRVNDAILAFPPLILAVAVVAVLGRNLTNAMVAIGIIFAPRFFRLTRAEVLSIREETYIEAARSIGTPTRKVLMRHVLPNALPTLIVQASLSAGFAMLAEASLSFLGLGVQPPQSSWGAMLAEAAAVINREWTLMLPPGICIIIVTLAFNILGDGLRDSIGREERRSD